MDIKSIIEELGRYLKESAGDKWDEVKDLVENDYLKGSEGRLINLTLEAATGNISGQFLADRAKDELTILESQALSLGIISASFTQETVNNTVQALLIVLIDELTKRKNED